MVLYLNKYRIESARLNGWDYSSPGSYFITICTKDMFFWFGKIKKSRMILNALGEIIDEEWKRTGTMRENVKLDYYQIMPNHFHGILILKEADKIKKTKGNNVSGILRGFKGACTKRIHTNYTKKFAWQSGFYDHIIRNETELNRIRNYIKNNPIKWESDVYKKNKNTRRIK